LAALLVLGAHAGESHEPTVTISDGALAGKSENGADIYLGVPFAAPPVGSLRWMPPAPPKRWTGVRTATAFRPRCVQNSPAKPIEKFRDEDCLYLNVYAPTGRRSHLPVIVWIYGGGFMGGSSQDHDGSVLARKANAVVVTFNYRLGAFGLLSLPALDRESAWRTSGNYSVLDQQAALRWVAKNITRFAGDPSKVTLMGESAGGMSVWDQVYSTSSVGLFSRAIVESGRISPLKAKDEEQRNGTSAGFLAASGCEKRTDFLACLRSLSADQVFDASLQALRGGEEWNVIGDGIVMPRDMLDAAQTSNRSVPVIAGTNAREGGFYIQKRRSDGLSRLTSEQFRKHLDERYSDPVLAARYLSSDDLNSEEAWASLSTDLFACNNMRLKRIAEKRGRTFYAYEFGDWNAAATVFKVAEPAHGPFHGSEIPYFFQTPFPDEPGATLTLDEGQLKLSDRIIESIKHFIRGEKLSPPWSDAGIALLTPNGDQAESIDDFERRHNCQLFSSHIPSKSPGHL
jgi:para-nitrobenzyl esterase